MKISHKQNALFHDPVFLYIACTSEKNTRDYKAYV